MSDLTNNTYTDRYSEYFHLTDEKLRELGNRSLGNLPNFSVVKQELKFKSWTYYPAACEKQLERKSWDPLLKNHPHYWIQALQSVIWETFPEPPLGPRAWGWDMAETSSNSWARMSWGMAGRKEAGREHRLSVLLNCFSLFATVATRLLCPWDSPGKNTRVGCHGFLQGIFLTQGSNPCLLCLLHWQVSSVKNNG